MYLNEYLNFKLGVELDDKYNVMAIKEVLNNKEKYPLIYETIENEVSYDDSDEYNGEDYDSGYFDCDDPECADFNETMELYNAFLNVFLKDIRKRDFVVTQASVGIDYLRLPNVHCIINPYLNYSGIEYITMNNLRTDITKELFIPNIVNKEYYGHRATETVAKVFFDDNKDVLNRIKEGLCDLIDKGDVSISSFNNERLKENKTELRYDITGYGYDIYELTVDNNIIRLYSSNRTSDKYGFIRKLIMNSLSEEEKNIDVVKNIDN